MTEKEIQEILDELNTVRPEKLNENAKRLFEAVMKIADERDKANNIINELEKWLEDVDIFQMNFIENKKHITPYKAVLDKLQELKGNDK